MIFRKHLLSLIIPSLFFVACSPGHKVDVSPADGPFITYTNVVYGADSLQQDMDVALPAKRDMINTPVVILIHGGSWVTGSKGDFYGSGLDTFFTSKGCALINVNYRLDNTYQYPAQIDDMGLIMDFIKQKAKTWNINPNRVCMFGRSSGSHLALLYAYSRDTEKRVKVVVDGFGPSDFVDSSVTNGPLGLNVTYLLGAYPQNQQAWHDASPVFYMSGAVPTVIFQGSADELVYPVQSQILQDSLLQRGVPCMFVSWVGAGHGWDQEGWLMWRDATWQWMSRFL